MKVTQKETFYIVGISVRTSNENGKAAKDIPALWQKFIQNDMHAKVPHRLEDAIYAVYTNYEKDHTKPYDTVLGFKVKDLKTIPENMVGVSIETSNYAKFVASGDLTKGVVVNKWKEIWNMDLDREYTSDFEVYGRKAQDPTNGEVVIFIAVK